MWQWKEIQEVLRGRKLMRLWRVLLPPRLSWVSWLAALISGGLTAAAFVPYDQHALAFVGLMPLGWCMVREQRGGALLAWAAGLVFFGFSLSFLHRVTTTGMVLLILYCSLYWAFVGAGWQWAARRIAPVESALRALLWSMWCAAWWVLWESVRGWIFTGFPWNVLGVSQHQNVSLIQIAEWGGPSVVSFLIVWVNLGLLLGLVRVIRGAREGRVARQAHPEVFSPILALSIAFVSGTQTIANLKNRDVQTLRIAVIQPNVGMHEKWGEGRLPVLYQIIEDLNRLANASDPDLIIWPETALPEELAGSMVALSWLLDLADRGAPILAGALDFKQDAGELPPFDFAYYNASVLAVPGDLSQKYYKRHLVLAGEYMPFTRVFPFLRSLSPMAYDLTPGTESGLFGLPNTDLSFGAMICFEDLMPYISRELADLGANFLITQTNDAWFDPSAGSRMHQAHAVFRCIEQRLPMVRCANTGVSCVIDDAGIVRDVLTDGEGHVQVRGTKTFDLRAPLDPATHGGRSPIPFILLNTLVLLAVLLPRKV